MQQWQQIQPMHYDPIDYGQCLEQFNQLLLGLKPLWQVVAFQCHNLPWAAQFPQLAMAVNRLEDDDIDAIDADPKRLFECLLPSLTADLQQAILTDEPTEGRGQQDALLALLGLLQFDFASLGTSTEMPVTTTTEGSLEEMHLLSHFSAHIKGRKWQQITAFTQACFARGPKGLPVLEWCAGKGHLGRLVAKTQEISVTSLEWQQNLCEQGQAFADKWHLPQRFICADAFKAPEKNESPIRAAQHAIALHACGDLHVRLLQLATAANTQGISISPCCYHLIQANAYQPLSELAQRLARQGMGLGLTRHQLQLPLQHSVIASPKQQQLRHQEVLWRLGFDSLQRHITGKDSYLPVPTLKQSQLSASFEAFCHWAAAQKGLTLPDGIHFAHYLDLGLHRRKLTLRLDLVSHLFRSALENWLLLDRACFLQEAGYSVSVSKFCPNSITPRNGFIQAFKY